MMRRLLLGLLPGLLIACGGGGSIEISITSPRGDALFHDNPIRVEGTASLPDSRSVTIRGGANAVVVAVTAGRFSAEVDLEDGENLLHAEGGGSRSGEISVTLESQVAILFPPDGSIVHSPSFHIRGVARGERPKTVNVSAGEVTQEITIEPSGSFSWLLDLQQERRFSVEAFAFLGGRRLEDLSTFDVYYTRPVVTEVHPEAAVAGTEVRLWGEHLGDDPKQLRVLLGEIEAELLSLDNTHVTFVVPEGAAAGLQKLVVERLELASWPQDFTVLLPGAWSPWTDESETRLIADDGLTTEEIAVGDVDGDQDLDLLLVRGGDGPPTQNRMLINDGSGVFADETALRLPAHVDSTRDAELADVDDDGDLDLLVINTFLEPTLLYTNDGSGRFSDETEKRLGDLRDFSCDALLADLDLDGDLDFVFSSYGDEFSGAPSRLYLSDLKDTKTPEDWAFEDVTGERFPNDAGVTLTLRAVDIEGDGDLDLIRNDREDQSNVYLNDGHAFFTEATGRLPADSEGSYEVINGDLDLDGDQDLYWVNFFGASGFDDGLLLNDGFGYFENQALGRIPQDGDDDNQAMLGDLDGDGDPDVFIASFIFGIDRLYENLGVGLATFDERTTLLSQPEYDVSLGSKLLDVDNDGDLDAIVGNAGSRTVRMYINHSVK